jgi:integrase
MGTIYKRGRIYWVQYYRNGKPYQESSKSQKEVEAKRLLRRREGEISDGRLPGIYFDKTTFDELKNAILDDYKLNNRKSTQRIEISISHLEESFKGMKIVNIDTDKISGYIKKRLNEGASNATINRELTCYKRMLMLGTQHTPPKVDKIPHIAKLKESPPRKGFFEHGDFLALRDKLPEHLRGFATFGYKTGWRLSEIETLPWSQVDLDQGIVILNPGETKNDEARTIYLDEELKEILCRQWENRGKGSKVLPWVFPNEDGSDRVKQFAKAWKTGCKNAKIKTQLFHDLRRTAVRNMVRSGIPESVAMQISGHRTRSVFERYNITSPNDLKQAAQRQEAYLKSQTITKTVTIDDFQELRAAMGASNSLNLLVGDVGLEPTASGSGDKIDTK